MPVPASKGKTKVTTEPLEKVWDIFKNNHSYPNGVFIVNFEHISHHVKFLLFTLNISIVNFKHAIAGWDLNFQSGVKFFSFTRNIHGGVKWFLFHSGVWCKSYRIQAENIYMLLQVSFWNIERWRLIIKSLSCTFWL